MSKPINQRRCVVCRQVKDKSQLLRVVKSSSSVAIDLSGKLDGRGAYVCKSSECALLLGKRRNFDKLFNSNLPDELYNDIKELVTM